MSSTMKFAIGVTIAVLICAAAFIPWGERRVTLNAPSPLWSVVAAIGKAVGSDSTFGGNPFQGMQITYTETGWNGYIPLGGLELPNWLVVVAAAGVTALCWLKALSVWKAHLAVPLAVAGYGLLHAGFAFVIFMTSEEI